MKILFRTSGGKAPKRELGFGHIYRCINLAQQLQGNEINFLVEDFGGAKKVLIERKFKKINSLRHDINFDEDLRKTTNLIKKKKIDVLIIDRYHLKPLYVKRLSKLVKTVIISDLRNIDYCGNLLINGFIGFKNGVKKNKYGTKCLLGPSYQILNKEFSRKRSEAHPRFTLLATFGGFDESNIVEILLSALKNHFKQIKTKIILGPATSKSKKMMNYEKKYGKNVTILKKTNSMYNEISDAEFGICSGGITTYEFAAMNKIFAIICQVEHQLITANEWKKSETALNFGMVNRQTEKKIEKFLYDIENKKLQKKLENKTLVDGKGSLRVANEILKLK